MKLVAEKWQHALEDKQIQIHAIDALRKTVDSSVAPQQTSACENTSLELTGVKHSEDFQDRDSAELERDSKGKKPCESENQETKYALSDNTPKREIRGDIAALPIVPSIHEQCTLLASIPVSAELPRSGRTLQSSDPSGRAFGELGKASTAKRELQIQADSKPDEKDEIFPMPISQCAEPGIRNCLDPNISYMTECTNAAFEEWINKKSYLRVVVAFVKYLWFYEAHPENHSMRAIIVVRADFSFREIEIIEQGKWVLYTFDTAMVKIRGYLLEFIREYFKKRKSLDNTTFPEFSSDMDEQIELHWHDARMIRTIDDSINYMVFSKQIYAEREILASY
ncbi:MAG: hypothetical protein M0R33_13965 [Methylomonas sp.]|jgi:hypothetical protein|uniref:hypothetical protein n=1 Tax=Methylomonas sp. TaxID=418 RepID=UPI0025D8CAD9|nr:hypothetical protein [Methylomonas sp.]MCK9607542.1 hypothetical protein [Methylomonas sp.]